MPADFFDTNVLVYLASGDATKADRAEAAIAAGKKTVVVTTAIAREMTGFIWAIARQVELQSA